MGIGEVIVTIVAILVGGTLAFVILVLMFGNRLTKQEMEENLDKEVAKENRKKMIAKVKEQRLKDKKEIAESIENIDISRKAEPTEINLDGYMEVFPESPKKTTKRKSTKKKNTKKVTE